MKKLYIFDFDQTLTIEHTFQHEASGQSLIHRHKKNREGMLENLRNPHLIRLIFEAVQNQGHVLAIASYHYGYEKNKKENDGSTYIKSYLKPLLEKNQPEPLIEAYQPDKRNKKLKKNNHIEKLVNKFNAQSNTDKIDFNNSEDCKRIIFIDDNDSNINTAKSLGIHTIWAKEGSDFSYLYKLCQSLELSQETLQSWLKLLPQGSLNEKQVLSDIIQSMRAHALTQALESPPTQKDRSMRFSFSPRSLRPSTLEKRQQSHDSLNDKENTGQELSPQKRSKTQFSITNPLQLPSFKEVHAPLGQENLTFKPLSIRVEDSPSSASCTSTDSASPEKLKLNWNTK